MNNEDVISILADLTAIDSDLLENCLRKLWIIPSSIRWCENLIPVLRDNNTHRGMKYYLFTKSVLNWIELIEMEMKLCLFKIKHYEETLKYIFDTQQPLPMDVMLFLRREINHHESNLRISLASLEYEQNRFHELEQSV